MPGTLQLHVNTEINICLSDNIDLPKCILQEQSTNYLEHPVRLAEKATFYIIVDSPVAYLQYFQVDFFETI